MIEKVLPRKSKKPVKRKRRKVFGFTKSALANADSAFSKKILARDGHCQYPGCQKTEGLTCSHYFGRAIKNTRFNEDNCIALCRTHHYWDKQLGFEYQKQTEAKHGWDGRYTIFMRERLGEANFEALRGIAEAKTYIPAYKERLLELSQANKVAAVQPDV